MNYKNLLQEMCYGKSNMFIHGGAGAGKSYLIHKMQEKRVNALYVAPSGIAALNINGKTIHAFFGLNGTVQLLNGKLSDKLRNNKERINDIRNADILLIDEISMVRFDLIDKIHEQLCIIRDCTAPFGGIRIIFVGDLFQLGAVVNLEDLNMLLKLNEYKLNGFSFYTAKILDFLSNFKIYELQHNFRQNKDSQFGKLLPRIRMGKVDEQLLKIINCQVCYPPLNDCYYLTTTNKDADEINKKRLSKLPGREYVSKPSIQLSDACINNKFLDILYIANEAKKKAKKYRAYNDLHIKKKAKIMFILNDKEKNGSRWVNGTIGKIVDIKVNGNEIISVIVAINEEEYEVERETFEIHSLFYNGVEWEYRKIADIIQFPFMVAWAATIDKCQGMTLKGNVAIKFGTKKVSRAGQVYVALSRATSLNTIFLNRPITKEDIVVSPSTKDFYDRIESRIIRVTKE